MSKIKVKLGPRSYFIYIKENILSEIGEILPKQNSSLPFIIITNPVLNKIYSKKLINNLKSYKYKVLKIIVPDGERYKSLSSARSIYTQLITQKVERDSTIIALGGGVIGDLAGFVAATYMRGINLVMVPTTLLSQVDSSIGGKVGVNLPEGKNLVGAFYQPKLVIIDPATLNSLPEREYLAGLAEVVKYAVIRDKNFFNYLKENISAIIELKPKVLNRIINKCCAIKSEIVSKDEKEKGLRSILNYGHTIGHALESLTSYRRILHGEAIAVGMTCAARIAQLQGLIPKDVYIQQTELLTSLGLPVSLADFKKVKIDEREIITKLFLDKKVKGGKIRFILPQDIGKVIISEDVPMRLVKYVLKENKRR